MGPSGEGLPRDAGVGRQLHRHGGEGAVGRGLDESLAPRDQPDHQAWVWGAQQRLSGPQPHPRAHPGSRPPEPFSCQHWHLCQSQPG